MPSPVRIVFLGCGFIAGVHSETLRSLKDVVQCGYASRTGVGAAKMRDKFGGFKSYEGYDAALADPSVDAVVVAIPPKYHFDLALRALQAGKHVLVEKPAFLKTEDYDAAIAARQAAGVSVLVGENDHYKPLVRVLSRLLADGEIGEMVFLHMMSVARRLKTADDWRNDEAMAGGDAFFEEGIHWLHVAGCLGPRITSAHGFRPKPNRDAPDARAKSMLVSVTYDNGAVGSIYYSREIPSFLHGLRISKIMGRKGVITFESNGGFLISRGASGKRFLLPGFRDIRGYRAMYLDFVNAIRTGSQPEMSLERAREDQVLMDQIYR